ncbi:hypothetical protein JCM9534A_47120 [Catenuloplanes indicus JCM 9534]
MPEQSTPITEATTNNTVFQDLRLLTGPGTPDVGGFSAVGVARSAGGGVGSSGWLCSTI